MTEPENGMRTVEFVCGCVITTWKIDGEEKHRLFRQDQTCNDPDASARHAVAR